MYRFISENIKKTYFYLALFFLLIVAVGYALAWYFRDFSFMWWAFGVALIYNFLAYFYSDRIVLRLNRAHRVTKTEEPELYRVVENLSVRTGLPMPRLYVIEDKAPNAFATGRDPHHAAIAVTRGLLHLLDREELRGVIAHEMSHIKNYDIRLQTVVAILVGGILILSESLRRWFWFSDSDDEREGISGFLLMLFLLLIAPLAARLIALAISRKREFLADATAVEFTRYPQGLIGALKKIHRYNQRLRSASLATAHLFFASPFGRSERQVSWIERLFLTHPPIQERIRALETLGF